MNLFWKKLFGGISSTEKLEKKEADLKSKVARYQKIAKSSELAEYNDLRQTVKSAEFKENKKTLQSRKYKDTEEFRSWNKFRKIDENPNFQKYLQTKQSAELQRYTTFKESADYAKLADKKAVSESANLQAMLQYERSQEYKNYLRYHGSFVAEEYEKLKTEVSSDDFKQRNAFWSNPKRWETTKEYVMDTRYYELSKNDDIKFYESVGADTFRNLERYQEAFVEGFDWNSLNASRWDFGFHYKSATLKGNHSFTNEQQANNNGHNVSVQNGILNLATKHETVTASAWDAQKGFVEKTFEYTSDVMQTSKTFRQKGGLFRAKLRCTGNIHHAFWLGADGKLPHVNIFHFNGKQITMGNAASNVFDQVQVTGLNPSNYYIYSLLWTEKEMIWYINDFEVFRTAANLPKEDMYLVFNSFIPDTQKAQPGLLEVDWVKAYTINE